MLITVYVKKNGLLNYAEVGLGEVAGKLGRPKPLSGDKYFANILGLPWRLRGKESACQCRRRTFESWVRKIPCRWKWQPTPVFWPGKSQGQRRLVGYCPRGQKESDMT